jgi:drug/metabolite transporter (DMT)-like permease
MGFIVPFVIGEYSVFDFTLVEFAFSGVLSGALLWRKSASVKLLQPRDWMAACSLGLIGYVGYFLAVMGAAIYAGPVVAPAFVGLVPMVLAIAGNFRQQTVSWKSLALPLVLAAVGLSLVNGSDFSHAGTLDIKSPALGIPLAILAVMLWTAFGLMNEAALARRPQMDAVLWTALIMAGAGAATLVFLPLGLLAGVFEIPRLGLHWANAGALLTWAAALAVFANFAGAWAWTFAAQRLPIALCAQLITMEPTSATILGLLVHRRWPTVAEALGMIVLLGGVVSAIGVFSRPGARAAAAA